MLPAQPNQSLIDGIRCLEALVRDNRPVGALELSRRLHLEPTRVHRLLKTLAYLGLARQNSERKYLAGSGVPVLGANWVAESEMLRRGRGPLRELQNQVPHRVALGILWGGWIAYPWRGKTGSGEEEGEREGVAIEAATLTGAGLILLAGKGDEEIERIYTGRAVPGYPAGLTGLYKDLRRARSLGYACVPLGRRPGHCSLALSLPDGEAALELRGRMEEDALPDLIHLLRHHVELMERGGSRGERMPL